MVGIDDFCKIELRVGKILSVENHPNADKLYVLKVDIGTKEIQLVAGIKNHYVPEELLGKSIIVVANLEPKELRGVASEGMLLAAQSGGAVSVLVPDRDAAPGSAIR